MSVDSVSKLTLMRVKIKASKTDPFRQGVDLVIGKTDNKLCPIAAMLAYLPKRGNAKGMLFHYDYSRETGLWQA